MAGFGRSLEYSKLAQACQNPSGSAYSIQFTFCLTQSFRLSDRNGGSPVITDFDWTSIRLSELSGKKVLITGGSTGIGAAVARAFAAQGVRLVIHYKCKRRCRTIACRRNFSTWRQDGSDGPCRYAGRMCRSLPLSRLTIPSGYITGQIIEVNGGQLMP